MARSEARRSGPRFFYGWWIVLGAVVGQFAAMGVAGQISGVFLRPMTDDLGWAAADYTLGTSAAFVAGGVTGFFIGPLVDRYGARPLMLSGGVMYGLALIGVSRVEEVWQFIALQTLAGGLGFAMVGPLVVNVTLSKWFVLRRGWAITIGSMGVSLAALIMPVTMTAVVDAEGWRTGYAVMGVLVWCLVLPVALLMRRTPEDYGLLPDGKRDEGEPTPVELAQRAAMQRDFANSFTRAEAVRTGALWMLVVGFGLNMAAVSAFLVHAIPFATDEVFTRSQAASGFAAVGLANFSSKFVWGFGLQRFPVRNVAFSAFVASAGGAALLIAAVSTESLAVLYAGFLAWGFGFGGTIPIGEFVWARYFGRRHLGAVRSVGQPVTILLGSLGPISMALYYDASGSYGLAFAGLAASYLLGGSLILLSREPQRAEPAAPAPEATPAPQPEGAPAGGG
ncbi:MAG: MFS transporter [Dehalococcoidia bacterium]